MGRFELLCCAAAISAGLAVVPLAAAHDDVATQDQDGTGHLERPGDPPGDVSIVQRTSPPANLRGPGGVTTVQVNVNSQGLNIVGDAANEPSIAVDPNNPNLIAIGWRQFDTIQSNFRQAGVGHSQDAGQTWTFPGVLDPGNFRSDPVLESNADGVFYYYSLRSNFLCDMFISFDGGQTWGDPNFAFGGDKAWFTIDTTNDVGRDNIYIAWSTAGNPHAPNQFTRSTNGGTVWDNPTELSSPNPRWGQLAVDANSDLYLSGWAGGSGFRVLKSTNAKNDGQTPSWDFNLNVDLNGSIVLGGGPNPDGLLGQNNIAVDQSNGNVYMLCSVNPPGSDPLDVYFARSTDGGLTWDPPVRVNDDPLHPNAWQWLGTMSVAPNGRIDVVWNDTRAALQDNLSELHYSSSSDGGETWSKNVALSAQFNSWLGWPQQNKMGDYFDMVSRNEGAYLAWAATFNGEQDVYFTFIPAAGTTADLLGFDVVTGTLLAGDVADLRQSDDQSVHTRSGFGETLVDLHHMELQISAVTTVDSPATLDLTTESRIDEPAGTAQVRLLNHNTQQFDLVGSHPLGSTDAVHTLEDIDATNYVDAQGEIELRIKHIVFVPFLAFTFESFIDWVEMVVE